MTRLVSRRAALLGAGGLALAGAAVAAVREHRAPASARARVTAPTKLERPRATPLRRFEFAHPDKRRFGALEFRSGLALASPYPGFGGFSGLAWLKPGERLALVADDGDWFLADVEMREGEMIGLDALETAPMLAPDGALMRRVGRYDAEGVTLAPDGYVYVSYERVHEIWRYDLLRKGLAARAEPVPLPVAVKTLGDNKSLESVAAPPPGHRLDGMLVTIAERPPRSYALADRQLPAWVAPTTGRSGGFEFALARHDEFDVSDCAFLPTGELLALERRFRLSSGMRVRLRRIDAETIRPGARVDGDVIFEAGLDHEIDNLEGLAVHRDGRGDVILTMCSDDNFNWFQRNLLLQFAYRP
jgi:hypothetical protein